MLSLASFLILVVTATTASAAVAPDVYLSNDFIEDINQIQSSWRAGRNFDKDTSLDDIRSLLGALPSPTSYEGNIITHSPIDLPKSFDAREKWASCPSIKEISNQGRCGSCWAVSSASTMTDRLCIHKHVKTHVSAQDLTSCSRKEGCNGGSVFVAFHHWFKWGLASGGHYGSAEGCRPYEIKPVNNSGRPCPEERPPHVDLPTPECKKSCENGIDYEESKTFGNNPYSTATVNDTMTEIYLNGPVVMTFIVYSDFPCYKEGIYQHAKGFTLGGHAVRAIGWGEENGVPYWLIANSWGVEWGNLGGTFKIRRGTDESHIESISPKTSLPK